MCVEHVMVKPTCRRVGGAEGKVEENEKMLKVSDMALPQRIQQYFYDAVIDGNDSSHLEAFIHQ